MPYEKHRVVRMNGQKAFDKTLGAVTDRFDGFGIRGKHVIGNRFSRKAEFFFGFSLPIPEGRFPKLLGKLERSVGMERHYRLRRIRSPGEVAGKRPVDTFPRKPFS